jgi:hypothetical protein
VQFISILLCITCGCVGDVAPAEKAADDRVPAASSPAEDRNPADSEKRAGQVPGDERLFRLKYNHPGLVVDLGVGLWAWPIPMDFDGDGDYDLVVDCPDVPYNGVYFFENPDGKVPMPVFKPGVRIGKAQKNAGSSRIGGRCRVLTPGKEYPDFIHSCFTKAVSLRIGPNVHSNPVRANQWKFADYDGDGTADLIVGVEDWTDYGWDNAFDARGRWTRGPLHGYVYLLRNSGTEAAPRYESAVKIEAGGKPIDTFGMPSPCLADFDGDGNLEIICGDFVGGFTYFENIGSRANPRYASGRRLTEKGGRTLEMDLCMIVPVDIDWDRDGDIDLIVGQEDGRVAFVENTGKTSDGLPVFEPPRFFRQIADDVKFGVLATPVAFDWNADGKEDLVCGDSAGRIGWIENLDGGNPPRWAAPEYLAADGKIIRIQAGSNGSIQGPAETKWGYATLGIADWDGDGLPDLLVNSIWGKVAWYRNIGARERPRLAASQPIEVEWPGKPPKPAWTWWEPQGKELATQWRTTPYPIDWTGDGLCDLAMLDPEGYLALYPRQRQAGRTALLPPRRIFSIETPRLWGMPIPTADFEDEPLQMTSQRAGKSGRRKFCFADWNGDGRLDILADGVNVNWLKNIDTRNGKTVFENQGPVAREKLAGHDTSPTVVHWNPDGIPDLLIGAEDGHFYLLPNPHRSTYSLEKYPPMEFPGPNNENR